jgi:pilus assembly protein CpaC
MAVTPPPAPATALADDTAARVARIEATAARLAQARARADRKAAVADASAAPQAR